MLYSLFGLTSIPHYRRPIRTPKTYIPRIHLTCTCFQRCNTCACVSKDGSFLSFVRRPPAAAEQVRIALVFPADHEVSLFNAGGHPCLCFPYVSAKPAPPVAYPCTIYTVTHSQAPLAFSTYHHSRTSLFLSHTSSLSFSLSLSISQQLKYERKRNGGRGTDEEVAQRERNGGMTDAVKKVRCDSYMFSCCIAGGCPGLSFPHVSAKSRASCCVPVYH